jgi:hypothetical protein
MAQLAPPPPPAVTLADDDGMARLQFRVWQVWITALTILITGWFITFGALAAIVALVVAKHVLVAVFLIGMDVYPAYKDDRELRDAGP